MLAKPRFGGAAPFAVEGGVGEDVGPGFDAGLGVVFCIAFCWLDEVLGLDIEL